MAGYTNNKYKAQIKTDENGFKYKEVTNNPFRP